MPFVRFARDKRGYEYVYLVHDSTRGGRSARPVVLYWYRTPPGVKVGRQPFDDEVRQRLEAQNPDLRFDWRAITSAQPPPPDAEHWRERRRAEKAAKLARLKDERADSDTQAAGDDDRDDRARPIAVDETGAERPAIEPPLELSSREVSAGSPAEAPAGTGENAPSAAPNARSRRRRRGRHRKQRPGGPEGSTAAPVSAQPAAHGAAAQPASATPAEPADDGDQGLEEPGDS